jgi:EmrB/QacA subfamily drug resistance transporter
VTPALSVRQKALATAGVMLALLVASLDQTVVGTAMPRIVAELRGLDYYAWVTTGYLVASTVVVPIAGKLGDLFGRKPFLLAGMAGFVGASALCGLSQNMLELTGFRALQGMFGGVLFATAFTVLADVFPPQERAKLQGLFGGVFGLSSVVGPTIGGWLTDGLGWRWVFYVNVPVGVVAVAVVLAALPFVRSAATWRDIDWAGSAVLAAGLVPLLIGLSLTSQRAWTSPQVLGLLVAALLLLGAFFFVERRAAQPIVPFELFRTNAFAVSAVIAFFTALGMFGAVVYVPLLYQGVLGVTATGSGRLLTPMVLGMLVASTLSGQLMARLRRYRAIGIVGVAGAALGLGLLSRATVGTSQLEVARDVVVIGVGLGLTMPLTINVVQSAVPRRFLGVASSQIQFWRNLGGTIGTAVLGSLLAGRLPGAIQGQVAALRLPAGFPLPAGVGRSPQALFDPGALAALRATVPAKAAPLFDQVVHAARLGLAGTLHELFLCAAALVLVALVAACCLPEVPLRPSADPEPAGALSGGPGAGGERPGRGDLAKAAAGIRHVE